MIIELEKEISKLANIKSNIEEMGDSLWQGSFRKTGWWARTSNAGNWILGGH